MILAWLIRTPYSPRSVARGQSPHQLVMYARKSVVRRKHGSNVLRQLMLSNRVSLLRSRPDLHGENCGLKAIGAALYEMATGRQALSAAATAVVFDAILDHEPPEFGEPI